MTVLIKTPHRRIPSFSRRQGRMTTGQKYAVENYWDDYCLNPDQTEGYAQFFGRVAPLIVEIGFGNGSSLAEMAEKNPAINYLGIEVHKPGVAQLMMSLKQKELNNVKIYHHDAIEILEKIANNSLTAVHLFFPDPWHKTQHRKRRIVRPSFVAILKKKLKSGGYFHAATDWEPYAKEMLTLLSSTMGLVNVSEDNGYYQQEKPRPMTKFENRGLALGYDVRDLVFKKTALD